MAIKVDALAPNFKAKTTQGDIDFYEWSGDSWVIFFTHPADFTPVCTTELGTAARLKPEFDKRNVKSLGLSIDSLEDHALWVKDIEETQRVTMNFPVIADDEREISILYGMLHPFEMSNMAVRSVFVIDPNKRVRLSFTYPLSIGRNFTEILRVIDALQLSDRCQVSTPADWVQGEDVVINTNISEDEIPALFPKGYKKLNDYLRLTPQPD
ncbi:MAG: peroxiredoxin [Saprospiraceae bacterium]